MGVGVGVPPDDGDPVATGVGLALPPGVGVGLGFVSMQAATSSRARRTDAHRFNTYRMVAYGRYLVSLNRRSGPGP